MKSYKDKELRQYILAYLLIAVASIGFQTFLANDKALSLDSLFQMAMTDILVGAISILVVILNEMWSDRVKIKIIYWRLPSNSVFTDIMNGKIDSTGFDLDKAKETYAHLSNASANKQTAEWNKLLRKSKEDERGNVLDAERMQLMTRDICLTTISLLILNLCAVVVLAIIKGSICSASIMLGLPIVYLATMLAVTRTAAKSRAKRLVCLVLKNDVQDCDCNEAK
jgi:hypothetical protein